MKKFIFQAALVITVSILIGILIHIQTGKYSEHKWHEGHREKVIEDIMKNYVYPGVEVSDVEKHLGTGIEDSENLKIRILNMFEYPADESSEVDVWIYTITNALSDTDNIRNSYFAVIHDEKVVLKTIFIDSAT